MARNSDINVADFLLKFVSFNQYGLSEFFSYTRHICWIYLIKVMGSWNGYKRVAYVTLSNYFRRTIIKIRVGNSIISPHY